jgi:hypothetical protein
MTSSASEIQRIIWQLGERTFKHKADMMICLAPIGDGTPHLEIHGDEYHYLSSERAFELSRQITRNLDELLYWFFKDKISSMSFKDESRQKLYGQDSRRIVFANRIELLSGINPIWGDRVKSEIAEILL